MTIATVNILKKYKELNNQNMKIRLKQVKKIYYVNITK